MEMTIFIFVWTLKYLVLLVHIFMHVCVLVCRCLQAWTYEGHVVGAAVKWHHVPLSLHLPAAPWPGKIAPSAGRSALLKISGHWRHHFHFRTEFQCDLRSESRYLNMTVPCSFDCNLTLINNMHMHVNSPCHHLILPPFPIRNDYK